jgi:hypothetical protein
LGHPFDTADTATRTTGNMAGAGVTVSLAGGGW